MAFEKKPAPWHNPGIEPSSDLKMTGWKAGMKPPADYFNWQWNRTYEAIKELQEKASEIKTINNNLPDEDGNINVEIDYSKSAKNEDFENHVSAKIYNSEVHGVRVRNGVIEYWNGSEWLIGQIGEGLDGLPISPVAKLTARAGNGRVFLSWKDPDNLQINGLDLSSWGSTRIVRKTNSYPINENDGVVVVSNSVRNQYLSTPFIDENLVNGVTYFYAAFPQNMDGQVTRSNYQRAQATPITNIIEEPDFDVEKEQLKVSWDPTTLWYDDTLKISGGTFQVHVMQDLAGYWRQGHLSYHVNGDPWHVDTPLPLSNQVEFKRHDLSNLFPFNMIRPVLMKNGKIVTELSKNDYSKNIYGETVDIYSGDAGDVMIEIPKIFFVIGERYGDGTGLRVLLKRERGQSILPFNPIGHKSGAKEKDYVYIGAYMGSNVNGKLRSLSGRQVETRKTVDEYRSMANNNGTGYGIMNYNQYMMMILLYLFYEGDFTPNRYPQSTVRNEQYTGRSTGTTDKVGLNAPKIGSPRENRHYKQWYHYNRVKLFGIEDLYGGYNTWLDGIRSDANCNYLIGSKDFNEQGIGYSLVKSSFSSNGHHIQYPVERPSSLDLNHFLLPLNTYEGIEGGAFSRKLSLSPNKPFITGVGNPTGTFFDFIFTDYVETDPALVSYSGARLIYF